MTLYVFSVLGLYKISSFIQQRRWADPYPTVTRQNGCRWFTANTVCYRRFASVWSLSFSQSQHPHIPTGRALFLQAYAQWTGECFSARGILLRTCEWHLFSTVWSDNNSVIVVTLLSSVKLRVELKGQPCIQWWLSGLQINRWSDWLHLMVCYIKIHLINSDYSRPKCITVQSKWIYENCLHFLPNLLTHLLHV